MRAYLAGPITGLSYAGCTDWRNEFASLVGAGIQCLSPMRGKDYLRDEVKIGDEYPDSVMSSSRGIMTRDFNDSRRCDILVVNLLGADKVSIGTVMEVAWAHAFRIPIVLVIEETGNPHDHAMIREATGFRVKTLQEAAHVVRMVLYPEA